MTLSIDSSRCQGHGRCAMASAELFEIDDDGYGTVLIPEPGPEYAGEARLAIDNCPEQAISLS
jgi:ferredoxin